MRAVGGLDESLGGDEIYAEKNLRDMSRQRTKGDADDEAYTRVYSSTRKLPWQLHLLFSFFLLIPTPIFADSGRGIGKNNRLRFGLATQSRRVPGTCCSRYFK